MPRHARDTPMLGSLVTAMGGWRYPLPRPDTSNLAPPPWPACTRLAMFTRPTPVFAGPRSSARQGCTIPASRREHSNLPMLGGTQELHEMNSLLGELARAREQRSDSPTSRPTPPTSSAIKRDYTSTSANLRRTNSTGRLPPTRPLCPSTSATPTTSHQPSTLKPTLNHP